MPLSRCSGLAARGGRCALRTLGDQHDLERAGLRAGDQELALLLQPEDQGVRRAGHRAGTTLTSWTSPPGLTTSAVIPETEGVKLSLSDFSLYSGATSTCSSMLISIQVLPSSLARLKAVLGRLLRCRVNLGDRLRLGRDGHGLLGSAAGQGQPEGQEK
jgi:hypothetical protein